MDDVPIRRYLKKSDATYPMRPMWVYGSIWDASSWATEDGKYKADYRYQPFVAKYSNFKAGGCSAYAPVWCRPVSASPYRSGGLSRQQYRAMGWVQRYHMIYNYCNDPKRDHRLTPECWGWMQLWALPFIIVVIIIPIWCGMFCFSFSLVIQKVCIMLYMCDDWRLKMGPTLHNNVTLMYSPIWGVPASRVKVLPKKHQKHFGIDMWTLLFVMFFFIWCIQK